MSRLKESQHLCIPLKDIEIATNNFENCIGRGGYGRVYKGELFISGRKTTVAVKRLNENLGQGLKEFLTEIQLLSGQTHPNLISLLGFCDEGKEKIIVYEYADRGSLDRYIRRSNTNHTLTWLERLKICLDAARGLEYLHNNVGKHQSIIHRDIKSANILIAQNWVAKISDLGLSKLTLAGLDRSAVISRPCGTPGYCEPEYIKSGIVKKESDVYSFGMVLFEVLCGRLCNVVEDDEFVLSATLVKEYYNNNKLVDIVDPDLRDQISSDSLMTFSDIAYGCLLDDREERFPMKSVVKGLEGLIISYQSPKRDSIQNQIRHSNSELLSSSNAQDLKINNSASNLITRKSPKSDSIQNQIRHSDSEFSLGSIFQEDPALSSITQKLKLVNRIAIIKDDGTVEFKIPLAEPNVFEDPSDLTELHDTPPIQIVMLIVGMREDIQPFVAIGKRLQDYGYRVRLATHSNFKEFVLNAQLEFYPLGGDPEVLAEYMVKNKGFLPSGPLQIPIQRNQMKGIIFSLLPACREPDPDTGIPFRPDAIIANPHAYGHTHVAEALKIPCHIFVTMSGLSNSEYPHPLSNVKKSSAYRLLNRFVDSSNWLGYRDIINEFREKKLKLRPVTYLSGSQGSEIPHGYMLSPLLFPKPNDCGPTTDVVGFCFSDLDSNYEPREELVNWLKAGPNPIYIGFGSLPVQESEKMKEIIVKALDNTGQRGIIDGLGNLAEPKDFIYSLKNIPHDWLFLQCASVVHHGGAGTTAAGLKAACPTTIVPFFGDQLFWGELVHARGIGPPPIPVDQFSVSELVEAIIFMLDPKVKERAVELAKAMEKEDGVNGAVEAFIRHFPRKRA